MGYETSGKDVDSDLHVENVGNKNLLLSDDDASANTTSKDKALLVEALQLKSDLAREHQRVRHGSFSTTQSGMERVS